MDKNTKFNDEASKKELQEYLAQRLIDLVNDYLQPMTAEEMNHLYKRVMWYLKITNCDVRMFSKANMELIENYTTYRKINVAVVITAISKTLD